MGDDEKRIHFLRNLEIFHVYFSNQQKESIEARKNAPIGQEIIDVLRELSEFTQDRTRFPVCAFCGNDMQDGMNNFPDDPKGKSDGPDPEHQADCLVVRARLLLSRMERG